MTHDIYTILVLLTAALPHIQYDTTFHQKSVKKLSFATSGTDLTDCKIVCDHTFIRQFSLALNKTCCPQILHVSKDKVFYMKFHIVQQIRHCRKAYVLSNNMKASNLRIKLHSEIKTTIIDA